MPELTVREYQQKIDQWIQDIGVRYFSELTNLGVLMEEVGEVARIMTRMYGDQSFKNKEHSANLLDDLADELADVLFVIGCIANQTNIDLTHAIDQNLAKKSSRDVDRHRNNPKLSDSNH